MGRSQVRKDCHTQIARYRSAAETGRGGSMLIFVLHNFISAGGRE
jgi:hypothetical protein